MRVDNQPLREHAIRLVESGETNWSRIAEDYGYMRSNGSGKPRAYGDPTPIRRRLGVVGGQTTCNTLTATKLAEVLGLDPVDIGI